MHDLKLSSLGKPPALARQSAVPGQARTLQNANRNALELLGHAVDTTGDPRGRHLRQLRLQQGIDPSLLATQACMSLPQLYELENGGNSRFYSDSLRRQAGRRVAHLLGTDWDALEVAQDRLVQSTSNVVHLQRNPVQALPPQQRQQSSLDTSEVKVERYNSMLDNAEVSVGMAVLDDSPIGLKLASPAHETLLVQHQAAYMPSTKTADKTASGWPSALTLLLVAAVGIGSAYVFVEYSPYRLYWPW